MTMTVMFKSLPAVAPNTLLCSGFCTQWKNGIGNQWCTKSEGKSAHAKSVCLEYKRISLDFSLKLLHLHFHSVPGNYDEPTEMGSTVSIYNATDLILDVALSQVGPLYYENKLQPGGCFERKVGKVWFTINAKLYTGDEGIYTDASVALPIVFFTLNPTAYLIGSALVSGSACTSTILGNKTRGTELLYPSSMGESQVKKIIDKLTLSSPGWYFGSDRTLYICGGPSRSSVQRTSNTFQCIKLKSDDVRDLYISENRPSGFSPL